MKFYYGLLVVLSLLVLGGCSNGEIDEPVAISLPTFTAIGEGVDNIYQYDFVSFKEDGVLKNLTQELGVGPSYLSIREVGDMLTFYVFDSNSFSASQYNVATGQKDVFENFYANSEQRAITWGANSEDRLFLGFYEPKGGRNLFVRVFDPIAGSEKDLFIENSILHAYSPLYYNNKLFVTYQDANSQYHIVVIENTSQTIVTRLDFGDFAPSILLNDQGELVVIKNGMGTPNTYAIYDLNGLDILEQGPFEVDRTFTAGYLSSDLIGNKFYYENLYIQPSTLVFGPAIYDLSDRTTTIIDLIGIVSRFQEEQQAAVIPTSQGYDPISRSILIGFGRIDNLSILEGGVLVISEKGRLIGHVDLPFVPTYFVKSTN
ncbi:MAG: hypothetical protein ACR2MT_14250 [Aurantibacter sp.]